MQQLFQIEPWIRKPPCSIENCGEVAVQQVIDTKHLGTVTRKSYCHYRCGKHKLERGEDTTPRILPFISALIDL